MTLTQLNAFVLVARLGSVTAAANALGVSESAVSQALSALRLHLGDQLVTRGPGGMTLTAGGSRLLSTASQIVVLGAEAHAAVRAAQGAPEQLRVVATSTIAEFVISPLTEAFTRRFPGSVEVSAGVAVTKEMGVLVGNRLADVAIGPGRARDPALAVVTEPIFRYRAGRGHRRAVQAAGQPAPVAVAGRPVRHRPGQRHRAAADQPGDPRGQDQGVPQPDRRLGGGGRRRGVAPAVEHLVAQQLRRGELSRVDVPGCRWTPAGTSPCWTASTGAPRPARSAASSARPRPCT